MSKKKSRTLDGSELSIWQILDAANSYYELSIVFTSTLPPTVSEPGYLGERMDLAVASATNRILALELYLKATLIRSGVFMPLEHDLRILFDALPKTVRQRVKDAFDLGIEAQHLPNIPWNVSVYFRLGATDLEIDDIRQVPLAGPRDESLSSLLIRNRGGFVASRYLFETAKRDEVKCYTYEHRPLALLCCILCRSLEASSQLPALYLRRFTFEGEL